MEAEREEDTEWKEKKKFIPAFFVETRGFKFDREECYEERLARFFKDENSEEAG